MSKFFPWNWFKCCRSKNMDSHELTNDYLGSVVQDDVTEPITEVITEPITSILDNLKVHKGRFGPNEYIIFDIYLLHGSELSKKSSRCQLSFSTFATNKDFLSWTFGQENQNQYRLYAGDHSKWYLLSRTGEFCYNRIYRVIHDSGEISIIVSNIPYSNKKHFITPIKRRNEMEQRLTAPLNKPPSRGFNPVPANSVLGKW